MREKPQPQAEDLHERAAVARLIAERHRENAAEHRTPMEDRRQTAEGLRDTTREEERQSATAMQLEGRLRGLEERVAELEALFRTLIAEQHRSTANERILRSKAVRTRTQEMTQGAKPRRKHVRHMRGQRDE